MIDKMFIRLVKIWAVFLLFELVLPIEGVYHKYWLFGYAVIVIYIVAIFVGSSLSLAVLNSLPVRQACEVPVLSLKKPRIYILSSLVVLGVIMVAINRIYIQGIDYTQGLAIAREAWKAASVEVGTTILGPVGNVFMALGVFLLLFLIYSWERFNTGERFIGVLAGIIGFAGQAVFTGGRSFLLIYGAGIYIAEVLRRDEGRGRAINVKYITSLGIVAVAYSIYIFQQRAGMNDIPIYLYAERWIRLLGGEAYPYIPEWLEHNLVHIGILISGYLLHSVWTLQEIVAQGLHSGQSMFVFVDMILSRIGITEAPVAWERSGYFAPLPGLILHDFGLIGVPIGGFVIGVVYSLSKKIHDWYRTNISLLGYIYSSIIIILSPIAFGFDVMLGFYFILSLGFLCVVRVV